MALTQDLEFYLLIQKKACFDVVNKRRNNIVHCTCAWRHVVTHRGLYYTEIGISATVTVFVSVVLYKFIHYTHKLGLIMSSR